MPQGVERETREIQLIALAAFILNLALAVAKYVVSRVSGSLALSASVVDSAGDSVASLAVFAGILISTRKTERFPLGLYKIENMISVVVAVFIFIAGYEIARSAFAGSPADGASSSLTAIIVMIVNTALIFAFGRFALHRGRATESPALIAEGRHRQADVLSSLVVLVSLLLSFFGLGFEIWGISEDEVAAVVVLVFVVRAGWSLLRDGMSVLLDASLPPQTLDVVRKAIESDPAVVEMRGLYGRSAGRFRFIQTTIALRPQGLERAHSVSHRIESAIREAVPHVERVVVHYEPARREEIHVAVPVENGEVSRHFGEAREFVIARCLLSSQSVTERRVIANPHAGAARGRGLLVAEWLLSLHVDVVVVGAEMQGRGASLALEQEGVDLYRTEGDDPDRAITEALAANQAGAGA